MHWYLILCGHFWLKYVQCFFILSLMYFMPDFWESMPTQNGYFSFLWQIWLSAWAGLVLTYHPRFISQKARKGKITRRGPQRGTVTGWKPSRMPNAFGSPWSFGGERRRRFVHRYRTHVQVRAGSARSSGGTAEDPLPFVPSMG